MLIAIVSDINTEVTETAVIEVRKLRAQRIIDEEALMSATAKANREYFPEFMEVLQAKASGRTGNVEERVEELAVQMNSKMGSVDEKVDKLTAEMLELKELTRSLIAK